MSDIEDIVADYDNVTIADLRLGEKRFGLSEMGKEALAFASLRRSSTADV
jgi:hypothetical protein